jgi:non-lysosomal glucosylceramidase
MSNDFTAGLDRRTFMKHTGAGGAALALGGKAMSVMAGPFISEEFENLIPADKKLSAAWLRSLTERGEPEWFRGEELKHIGMPVGGICCGQVYLSGDGRLWHWDIFNAGIQTATNGPHYAKPMSTDSGIGLGFTLRARSAGKETIRPLDRTGFSDIRFRGAYPMGFVDYADDGCPVDVSLEAFSPFCPLEVDDSSLPLTVMRYTVRNPSANPVEVSLAGQLPNPVLQNSGKGGAAEFVNTIGRRKGATYVHYTVGTEVPEAVAEERPDVVFEDFEADTYENWTVEGTAFGQGPVLASELPGYQGSVGAQGKRLVNSHNTRQGEDIAGGDAHVGVMTSKPFAIDRRYIHALVGGGADVETVALQLLIGDQVVAKLAGKNNNAMQRETFVVEQYAGQTARLRIVDASTGGWGNIGVDDIVFSDRPAAPEPLDNLPDMGDMTLAVLEQGEHAFGAAGTSDSDPGPLFATGAEAARSASHVRPVGAVGKTVSLQPGEEATVSFAIAWRFPNQRPPIGDIKDEGHYYATRFSSSVAVIHHLADRYAELYGRTRLWHDTWYESTLPHWLLDRTFVNTSILATGTCLRFQSGRLWGWEGVGCCAGTCSHVWHYGQSIGRVFPELERIVRERVDYGLAYQPDGRIFYRGEWKAAAHEAIDGQCGTILRVYREHTMSADDAFLCRIWPRVKRSIEFLMNQEGGESGVLTGKQMNTLDSAWYGPISWISSLYLATLRAGAEMATEMGDDAFSVTCKQLADKGGKLLTETVFDGEYFFHRRDPAHPGAIGSGVGCHIDQVFGQGWAHQLGLERVLPEEETQTALRSLWRYNFTPDVGPYRTKHSPGRWYAVAGEAGLIMCTFPRGGMREAGGGKAGKGFAGYFNECMTGFEYQAAGHMIADGLVQEGLAVTRAIHDRYHASRRNPYNEIECGDHYARAMASHGVFVSICGFEHHGPKGHIGFAPKLTPENFKAPFIAAEGWGSFTQKRVGRTQTETLQIKYGQLSLKQMTFALPSGKKATSVQVTLDGTVLAAEHRMADGRVVIQLADATTIQTDQLLEIEIWTE